MRLFFVIVITLFLCIQDSNTYTGFKFTYDAAGNRTYRKYFDPLIKMGTYESYEAELNEHKIQVFPNPTDGELNVNIENLNEDSESKIEVYDIKGTKLFEVEVKKETELNLTEQPNGVYILRIIIDGKIGDWKIVKKE